MKNDTKTKTRMRESVKEMLVRDFKSIYVPHSIACQSNWRSEIDKNMHKMDKVDGLGDFLCTVLVPQEHPGFLIIRRAIAFASTA